MSSNEPKKNQVQWPLSFVLQEEQITTGMWQTSQWLLQDILLSEKDVEGTICKATLHLHRDERTDYRFNLSSVNPKLFVVLETTGQATISIHDVTVSQSVAGHYLDGDYLVLSKEMPLAIQAWVEAFIGRNGELLEQRRKKRKGAGRSSGK
ncbi:DUF3305 domain-containing protein [Vibrio sonorensis]|uniref:DUF3305 domain-containing protein n=1 Tax=Vibrio sonorensis TaxID=1004316 RepID=UPI0008D9CC32|nr:DUF3305 domain-containing protein [Vibrio sonorensis]